MRDTSKKIKINKSTVASLPQPASGQVFYRDTELTGFAVRVTAGSKSFIVENWCSEKRKAIRITLGKFPVLSAETARKMAHEKLSLIIQGQDPNEQKKNKIEKAKKDQITLLQAWKDYESKRELRETTVEIYAGALRRYFSDWLELPISKISKDMVMERYLQIVDKKNVGPRSNKNGATAAGHQAIRVLRSIFYFAGVMYTNPDGSSLLPENPVSKLSQTRTLRKVGSRKSHIKRHQLASWFRAVLKLENDTIRDFLLLLIFTGLRRSEAAGLRWSEIDFANNQLIIPAERSKTGIEHILPLSNFVFQLLKKRPRDLKSNFVFPGDGAKGHLVEPKKAIERVVAASVSTEHPEGIDFTCHDLRRTFITVGEGCDVPFLCLKRLSNHKFSDQTSEYAQLSIDRLREPMQRITDEILKAAKLTKSVSLRESVECEVSKVAHTSNDHEKLSIL
ncbi:MAG: tyrosine-type recombinase/integrase [Cyanobacteria bacterium TGS_CYA1]|nr:tyrosine-type recombinase/integrase [Cyanobacteria bacterium TGS_CYA1]